MVKGALVAKRRWRAGLVVQRENCTSAAHAPVTSPRTVEYAAMRCWCVPKLASELPASSMRLSWFGVRRSTRRRASATAENTSCAAPALRAPLRSPSRASCALQGRPMRTVVTSRVHPQRARGARARSRPLDSALGRATHLEVPSALEDGLGRAGASGGGTREGGDGLVLGEVLVELPEERARVGVARRERRERRIRLRRRRRRVAHDCQGPVGRRHGLHVEDVALPEHRVERARERAHQVSLGARPRDPAGVKEAREKGGTRGRGGHNDVECDPRRARAHVPRRDRDPRAGPSHANTRADGCPRPGSAVLRPRARRRGPVLRGLFALAPGAGPRGEHRAPRARGLRARAARAGPGGEGKSTHERKTWSLMNA